MRSKVKDSKILAARFDKIPSKYSKSHAAKSEQIKCKYYEIIAAVSGDICTSHSLSQV